MENSSSLNDAVRGLGLSLHPLANFLDKLGSSIHGPMWPSSPWSELPLSTKPPKAGTPRATVVSLRDDLEAALSDGAISAVLVAQARVSRLRLPIAIVNRDVPGALVAQHQDEDDVNILNAGDVPRSTSTCVWPEETFDAPSWQLFKVRRSFWRSTRLTNALSWKTSFITIPSAELLWRETPYYRKVPLNAKRPQLEFSENRTGKLFIVSPEEAIKEFFVSIEMPEESFLQRYKAFRSLINQELVTAGWRYLALHKPAHGHGVIKKIEDAMKIYWASQQNEDPSVGRLPGPSSLQALATKIHDQWVRRDEASSALINTVRPPNPNRLQRKK